MTTTALVVHRTAAAAEKSGNVYTARAECAFCGYAGKWTHAWKAEELAAGHECQYLQCDVTAAHKAHWHGEHYCTGA